MSSFSVHLYPTWFLGQTWVLYCNKWVLRPVGGWSHRRRTSYSLYKGQPKGRRDLNRYLALSAWAPDSGFSWFRTCKCEEWSLLSWHLWIHQRMFQMSLLYLQALLWSFAWIPRHYLFFLGKTAVKRRPGKPHSLHEPGEALILTLLGREERRTELSEGPVGFCLKC